MMAMPAAQHTHDLRRQIWLTVGLQLLAGAVLGGPLLLTGALVNDRLADFYFFRDTLHSVNVFGEFPWWNPSIWVGFPSYYINFLYWPGREPLFALLSAIVWLLGRAGVIIDSYHAWYVVYFAFLVPLLLSLSLLALARQILRSGPAVYLAIALTAFSPGVVLSISDLGSEISAYGFLFAAALLHFIKRPDRRSFLLLCMPAVALASALTFFQLFWNIFFVPAFIALVCLTAPRLRRRTLAATRIVPPQAWAGALAVVVLCALPSLIAYASGDDILASRADGAQVYRYEVLRPGMPLEVLAISTPGVGFEWTQYDSPSASFEPRVVSRDGGFASFGYMGLLTLPLACLGLTVGRRFWSIRLLACVAAGTTVILLSAYSPLFSLILSWAEPLRGVNHHSDLSFRLGLFAVFILAAGLGFEWVLRGGAGRRWVFAGLFAASAIASITWLIAIQGGGAASQNYLFGLALAFVFLYGLVLVRFAIARTATQSRTAVAMIILLTLLDTSALAFAHLRGPLVRASGFAEEPAADVIGGVVGREEYSFLYLRGMDDAAFLDDYEARMRAPASFVPKTPGAASPAANIAITDRTYNGISMRVDAPAPGVLKLEDAYFPYWRAWINGREVPITRTERGMKAVELSAGLSDVQFTFSPTLLRMLTAAAYGAAGVVVLLWVLATRSASHARQPMRRAVAAMASR